MRLRSVVILLAVIPFVLSIAVVAWIVRQNNDQLAKSQIAAIEPILVQARKDELKHFVQIARSSIVGKFDDAESTRTKQTLVLELFRRMDFGEDNYLYVYDVHGLSLMHPRLRQLEGKNQWELRDGAGSPIIQKLISMALSGGGYVEYLWNRPSTGQEEPKMGYVELIPEWGWVLGTGLYLDDLIKTQSVITKATTETATKIFDQILLVSFIALLFVAGGGMALNMYEQREANEKLRAMARKVVLSQELERTRVARELHDGVSQLLASVKFVFESALIQAERETDKVPLTLREGLDQMRCVMREVRRISHGLRPTLLNDLGLKSAIEQISREFSERTNIVVGTQFDSLPKFQEEIATEIFRVVQEALSNVEKHAHANHVWIALRFKKNELFLAIKDDGLGFDVESKLRFRRDGLGLTNMRERIEMLGGYFKVDSKNGGTLIAARLALQTIRESDQDRIK